MIVVVVVVLDVVENMWLVLRVIVVVVIVRDVVENMWLVFRVIVVVVWCLMSLNTCDWCSV